MGRDDKVNYTVIHHLGAASEGAGKPAGAYAPNRAGRQDLTALQEAGGAVRAAGGNPGGSITSAAGTPPKDGLCQD